MKRRQFIGFLGNSSLALLATTSYAHVAPTASKEFVFIEAEQFAHHGGWELDQQSMEQMGSPYLLAHGLGIPVPDATTQVEFPSAGFTEFGSVRGIGWRHGMRRGRLGNSKCGSMESRFGRPLGRRVLLGIGMMEGW